MMRNKLKKLDTGFILPLLIFSLIPIKVLAQPNITAYAECSGILVVAASLSKTNDPDKSAQYLKDAEVLEYKASKIKGYNKGIYKEISFNSSGNYVSMIKRESISDIDFWSDAGYCRGLAQ